MTIKDTALRLTARFLATGLGNTIIKAVAFRDPARHLYASDRELYMSRWHVVREGTFASRVLQKLTGYSAIRLHHTHRSDQGRDLHNHPFTYRTFVLDGHYVEAFKPALRKPLQCRTLWAGSTARHDRHAFHRISAVSTRGVWTLFCMTRNMGEWGFLRDSRYVPSARYLKARGFNETSTR